MTFPNLDRSNLPSDDSNEQSFPLSVIGAVGAGLVTIATLVANLEKKKQEKSIASIASAMNNGGLNGAMNLQEHASASAAVKTDEEEESVIETAAADSSTSSDVEELSNDASQDTVDFLFSDENLSRKSNKEFEAANSLVCLKSCTKKQAGATLGDGASPLPSLPPSPLEERLEGIEEDLNNTTIRLVLSASERTKPKNHRRRRRR